MTAAVETQQQSPMELHMRKQRLSYRDLAFITGLSAGYLNRIARGERTASKATMLTIARALKTSPATVFPEPAT